MRLSVLITSFQRANLLKWNLSSLKRQDLNDFEIIVLNDGIVDGTETICQAVSAMGLANVKYVFTGQRNHDGIKWRVPGYALNIGAKLATGNALLISCAETFLVENDILRLMAEAIEENPKQLVITEGKDDGTSFLRSLPQTEKSVSQLELQYKAIYHKLNTKLPFCMGVSRSEYINIGGYDEDFIGMAWDDNDFVDRMIANGCVYNELPRHCVHLWHSRGVSSEQAHRKEWSLNHAIYQERQGIVIRNQNREWGKL